MALVKLSPEQIVTAGGEIKAMGDEVDTLLSDINALVGSINGVWEGLANNAFAEQYQQLYTTLKSMPDQVKAIGESTIQGGEAWATAEQNLTNSLKG